MFFNWNCTCFVCEKQNKIIHEELLKGCFISNEHFGVLDQEECRVPFADEMFEFDQKLKITSETTCQPVTFSNANIENDFNNAVTERILENWCILAKDNFQVIFLINHKTINFSWGWNKNLWVIQSNGTWKQFVGGKRGQFQIEVQIQQTYMLDVQWQPLRKSECFRTDIDRNGRQWKSYDVDKRWRLCADNRWTMYLF